MYRLAKTAYDADGRDVVNCTEGGKLEVFPRDNLKNQLTSVSREKVERVVHQRITTPANATEARRRLTKAEPTALAPDAWGNRLAFKDDPGMGVVRSAFVAKMQSRTKSTPKPARAQSNKSSSLPRPFYATIAERLQKTSPRICAVVRLAKRALAAMWHRRLFVAPFVFIFAFIFFARLAQSELEYKLLLSGGAVLLGIFIVVLYLGWWAYNRIRVLALEMAALRRALNTERNKIQKLQPNAENKKKHNKKYSLTI